jgi:hypothetical protein
LATDVPVNCYTGGAGTTTAALEAQLTLKVSSTSKATGQRRHDIRHVSVADRLRIKCLQIINDCNNPITIHSV